METLRALLAFTVSTVIAVWFVGHLMRALTTGSANVHNVVVRRRGRPVYYWIAVTVQAAFAGLFVFFAVVNAVKLVA